MHTLAARARDSIRRYGLLPQDATVLVALSGGSDSVAMLLLLLELAEAGDLHVAAAAHFNHQLRGVESDADERFCRALAWSLGVPIEVGTGDVLARATADRLSIENAGRRARYEFLAEAADTHQASVVAVGHTRNDQAETVIQKLVRGAGWRGLAGIHPRRGRLIRPLLDLGRDELRAYLAERGQPFCEDRSNRDLTNPRNRIRHELVPYLETHLSPGVVEVLAREATLARETADWLDSLALVRASTEMWADDDRVEVSVAGLTQGPIPVAKAFARLALRRLAGPRFVGSAHVDALLALAGADSSVRLKPDTTTDAVRLKPDTTTADGAARRCQDFPGQRASWRGDRLVLTRQAGRGKARPSENLFRETLSVPGEVAIPELDCRLTAEPGSAADLDEVIERGGRDAALVDGSRLTRPLTVRLRRPGDRFRPLGLAGRKKLHDFFIDRKVPRQERDRVPLVVDADDRIVWVAGHAVADDFRVSESSAGVIILKRKRLGGIR